MIESNAKYAKKQGSLGLDRWDIESKNWRTKKEKEKMASKQTCHGGPSNTHFTLEITFMHEAGKTPTASKPPVNWMGSHTILSSGERKEENMLWYYCKPVCLHGIDLRVVRSWYLNCDCKNEKLKIL